MRHQNMSDSSPSEAEEETREFMTVREEREARVDIQQMIQSANELLDSAGLPEQPLQQEMMEAGQNNEPENSDSESDSSSLQNSSSDEYVEGDISLDFL